MTRSSAELSIAEADPEVLAQMQALASMDDRWTGGGVLTGTAGWTDKTLIACKRFYPKGCTSAAQRLEFYARQFPLVEVDATYYAILSARVAENWVEATPEAFRFNIKAHPVLTGHPLEVARLPKDIREELRSAGVADRIYPRDLSASLLNELKIRSLELLAPLERAGRLGCLMAQFPPWFTATRGNARALTALRDATADLPVAVEFRHKSWLEPGRAERVFGLLSELGFSYVAVDEPPGAYGGLPEIARVTNPRLAVVRFHGRNASGWKAGKTVWQRFNYLYSKAELAPWVPRLNALRNEASNVHAVFNNCVRDYAVLNAKALATMLESTAEPRERPE